MPAEDCLRLKNTDDALKLIGGAMRNLSDFVSKHGQSHFFNSDGSEGMVQFALQY